MQGFPAIQSIILLRQNRRNGQEQRILILCSFFDYGMAAQIAELPICRVIALFRTSSLTGEAYDIALLRADGGGKSDEGHDRLVFVSNVPLRISFFLWLCQSFVLMQMKSHLFVFLGYDVIRNCQR